MPRTTSRSLDCRRLRRPRGDPSGLAPDQTLVLSGKRRTSPRCTTSRNGRARQRGRRHYLIPARPHRVRCFATARGAYGSDSRRVINVHSSRPARGRAHAYAYVTLEHVDRVTDQLNSAGLPISPTTTAICSHHRRRRARSAPVRLASISLWPWLRGFVNLPPSMATGARPAPLTCCRTSPSRRSTRRRVGTEVDEPPAVQFGDPIPATFLLNAGTRHAVELYRSAPTVLATPPAPPNWRQWMRGDRTFIRLAPIMRLNATSCPAEMFLPRRAARRLCRTFAFAAGSWAGERPFPRDVATASIMRPPQPDTCRPEAERLAPAASLAKTWFTRLSR